MPKPDFAHPPEGADDPSVLAAYQRAEKGRKKERLLMVLLSFEGTTPPPITQRVKRDVDTVRSWLFQMESSRK